MKIDIKYLGQLIQKVEEEKLSQREDYKRLMGIISGNKSYIKRATLNDICYLLENLECIIAVELKESYPKIKLWEAPNNKVSIRRAL